LDAAEEKYAKLVQDWPDSEWADDSLHLQIQLTLAKLQYERVVSLGEQFQLRFPASPFQNQVRQCLGRGYLKQKQYAQAIETLKPLIETPVDVPPLADPGDDPGEPVVDITSEAASSLQASRYYLGLAYVGDRQYAAALESLAQVRVSPEQADLYGGVRLATAMALSGLNRPTDAIEPLRQYLAAQPRGGESAACRVQLIDALLQCDRLDDAIRTHAVCGGQERPGDSPVRRVGPGRSAAGVGIQRLVGTGVVSVPRGTSRGGPGRLWPIAAAISGQPARGRGGDDERQDAGATGP